MPCPPKNALSLILVLFFSLAIYLLIKNRLSVLWSFHSLEFADYSCGVTYHLPWSSVFPLTGLLEVEAWSGVVSFQCGNTTLQGMVCSSIRKYIYIVSGCFILHDVDSHWWSVPRFTTLLHHVTWWYSISIVPSSFICCNTCIETVTPSFNIWPPSGVPQKGKIRSTNQSISLNSFNLSIIFFKIMCWFISILQWRSIKFCVIIVFFLVSLQTHEFNLCDSILQLSLLMLRLSYFGQREPHQRFWVSVTGPWWSLIASSLSGITRYSRLIMHLS